MENPTTRAFQRFIVRSALWLLAALLVVAFVIVCIWFIARGSIAEALRLPPVVDHSTPRTQKGITLVDVERSQYDGAVHLTYLGTDGPAKYVDTDWMDGQEAVIIRDDHWADWHPQKGYAPIRVLHQCTCTVRWSAGMLVCQHDGTSKSGPARCSQTL